MAAQAPAQDAPMRPAMIYACVFVGGMTTLGVEICASRLLGSFFGGSNIVWANVIGLMLLYLTVGYYLGGRWADRSARAETLYAIMCWAALLCAAMPLLAQPLLRLAARALVDVQGALALGSFFATLTLFAAPITLLGCVSPFAIRLSLRSNQALARAGRITGNLYAISTLGSLLGTFGAALLLIPQIGTMRSFLALAAALYALAFYGLWQRQGKRAARWLWMPALIAILVALWLRGPLRPAPAGFSLLSEAESEYHYLQVIADEAGRNYLHLNEGQGIHSIWHPDERFFGGSWDFFLAAPYFNPAPHPPNRVDSLLIIGLAGGTIAHQHRAIYGDIPMTGIELDGEIIALAEQYFGLNEAALPSLTVRVQDGRFALRQLTERYAVIAIDAYRPPYIPWQLATREFFAEARARLREDGVLAINVGRAASDRRLIDALTATLLAVYPSVHAIDVPHSFNTILVASIQPTDAENLAANLAWLPPDAPPALREILQKANAALVPARADGPVFHDDHAPIEMLVDAMVLRFLLSDELAEFR